jgi:hypothetical protein
MIIGFNTLLRYAIIQMVELVREDSHSRKLTVSANGTFYATFFNTGILLTIMSANLTEHGPKFLTKYITGPYYDYTPNWYSEVGFNIVRTMLINAVMPNVLLATGWLVPFLYRWYDRKFSNDPYTTR